MTRCATLLQLCRLNESGSQMCCPRYQWGIIRMARCVGLVHPFLPEHCCKWSASLSAYDRTLRDYKKITPEHISSPKHLVANRTYSQARDDTRLSSSCKT